MGPDARTPDDSGDGHVFQYACADDDQPAIAIVKAVSWVKDVDVCDLDPLHNAIDADELNSLFGAQPGDFTRSSSEAVTADQTVTFRYEGCRVTVTTDEVRVDPVPAER